MRRVGKPNVARRRGKHFPLDIVSRSPNSGVGTWGFFPDPKQTISSEAMKTRWSVGSFSIVVQVVVVVVVVAIQSRRLLNERNSSAALRWLDPEAKGRSAYFSHIKLREKLVSYANED